MTERLHRVILFFVAVRDYFTERFDESGEGGAGGGGNGDGVPWKIMKGDLEGGGAHLDVGDIVCFTGVAKWDLNNLHGRGGVYKAQTPACGVSPLDSNKFIV